MPLARAALRLVMLIQWRMLGFYGILSFLVLVDGFLCGTFFLEPYYSLYAGRQSYTEPVNPDFSIKEDILTVQVVATCGLSESPTVHAFASMLTNMTDGSCPDGFRTTNTALAPLMDGVVADCIVTDAAALSFVMFDPEFDGLDSSDYIGPRMRSTVMHTGIFSMPDDIIRYQDPAAQRSLTIVMDLRLYSADARSDTGVHCTHIDQCADFLKDVTEFAALPEYEFALEPNSLACTTDEEAAKHDIPNGCSVGIKTADPNTCTRIDNYIARMFHLSEKYKGECAYTIAFELYPRIPMWLGGTSTLWSWGGIAFTSLLFINVLLKFWYFRKLHLNYVSQYYLTAPPFTLKRRMKYIFKLYVTGERFSSASGWFRLIEGRDVIFEERLDVEFDEEDRENTGLHTVKIRVALTAQDSYQEVVPSISWDEDFRSAGNMTIQGEQMTCRREFPWGIKNAVNLVTLPLYLPLLVIPWGYRKFVAIPTFLFLTVYLMMTHLSYLIPMFFGLLAYVRIIPPLTPFFWHTGYGSPPLVLACYIAFLAVLFIPTAMTCIPFAHRRRRGWADVPGHLRAMTINQKSIHRDGQVPEAFVIGAPPSSAVTREFRNNTALDGDYYQMRRMARPADVPHESGMTDNALYQAASFDVGIGPRGSTSPRTRPDGTKTQTQQPREPVVQFTPMTDG